MTDPFEVMQWQAAALFTHTASGRIVQQNETDGPPAPLFFLGCTATGNLWRVRHDIPSDAAERIDAVARREPVDSSLPMRPYHAAEIIDLVGTVASVTSATGGPAYYFPDEIPAMDDAIRIDRNNIGIRGAFDWLDAELEDRRPCFAIVRDGVAVALCFSSRRSPRACEAGVETLEEHRGRGYATAVTAAWARAVRSEGLTPLYSTSWDNLASRAVARRLGLIQYGTDWSIK
jgi:RimJ/RimL family protein N-acetyltransferase